MTTITGYFLEAVGLDDVRRYVEKVERKADRERQKAVRVVARRTLAAAVRNEAPRETDHHSGKTMKSVVSARNGKGGTVLVGPRGGKRGVWFRHITVGGAAPHQIPEAGHIQLWGRPKYMSNAKTGFRASGVVMHPGRPANPFVKRGTDAAMPAFLDGVASVLFSDDPEVK